MEPFCIRLAQESSCKAELDIWITLYITDIILELGDKVFALLLPQH